MAASLSLFLSRRLSMAPEVTTQTKATPLITALLLCPLKYHRMANDIGVVNEVDATGKM